MALLFASPSPAPALGLPLQISQYAHTSWTSREGAMQGLIFAMAQTPDGYLWLAGSFGLFRFDGVRFMPWKPPNGQSLPSGPYSLLASRDGTLWIGTYDGLASWNGREFISRHPEVGGGFVTSLLEDRDGTIWVGMLSDHGRVCSIRPGQTRCSVPEAGLGAFVWSLAQDRSGHVWVGADTGVWRWSPGTPQRYPLPGRVGDLTTTADGQVLAGIQGGGLVEVAGDRLVPHRFRRAGEPGAWLTDRDVKSNKLLRDRDGGLWIGTQGLGLIHVKDGQADTLTRAEGLSGSIACSLFEDREGNIWYGSDKGVDRFVKLPVTTLSSSQGLPDEITRSIAATTDGSLWVATNDGLARWTDGTPTVYKERDGLPDSHVHSLYQDTDGRLWVSTARGLAYFENGRFVGLEGLPSQEIYVITGDAAGNLWLSGNNGLARLHRGRFVENFPWATFGRKHPAHAVLVDRGGVWLSFWDEAALYFKDRKVEATYTSAQGLGAGHVAALRLDAEGAVWAATGEGGLSRIKNGRVTTLTVANGLPCNRIHWTTLDNNGSLWMYTICGLVRVGRDELAAWIADPKRQVKLTHWGGADGVPLLAAVPSYYNPPVAKTPDGKLWFVGAGDMQVIDPDHMPSNPVPPPVHIENFVADNKPYAVAHGLHLPPLVRDITIEFVALTLVDPKRTRFRYRLEGHDQEWQEAIDRRQATYTNLPPGRYRFHVKAANNSGVWNEDGAQLEFSIQPAFYQTTWFRVAVAVVLAGLAWSGFQLWMRMRIGRLRREFEATLEARVAERTRIARELHDTLLQRFHGLLLQFQAAFNLLPDRPRESKHILARAIDQVGDAITEGRDTVQALRSSVTQKNSLAESLSALVEDLAHESDPAPSAYVQVHGTSRDLHPLVRDEIFRIASEALRNAFRHAHAKRIDVEISYGPRQLRVQVRDDGQGIDPQVMGSGEKKGHFGLSGMRERAEIAGGQLTVRSAPGAGTEVEFTVPGARAYSRPLSARSWILQKMSAFNEIRE
jgi:signal transduction histidine kinase/ligand-binding sensor domain-containing protein